MAKEKIVPLTLPGSQQRASRYTVRLFSVLPICHLSLS
jgi:hypothetical protein